MQNRIILGLMLGTLLSGCATADLSSGKKFEGFQKPPAGKSMVYFLRNENFMVGKLPYIFAGYTKMDVNGEPIDKGSLAAIVGAEMFVPVLIDPGTYLITSSRKDVVTINSNEVKCIEIGRRFRGITVSIVEEMPISDCEKVLLGKYEGVPVIEARKRMKQIYMSPQPAPAPVTASEAKQGA